MCLVLILKRNIVNLHVPFFFELADTSIASLGFETFSVIYISLIDPPRLCCDNISALAVASNPVYQARMRHVKVDYHYINVTRKKIVVDCVASTNQLVDLLTKRLSSSPFTNPVSKLPVHQRLLSLQGRDKPTDKPKPNQFEFLSSRSSSQANTSSQFDIRDNSHL